MTTALEDLLHAATDLFDAAEDGRIDPLEAAELAADAVTLLRRVRIRRSPAALIRAAERHERRAAELRARAGAG